MNNLDTVTLFVVIIGWMLRIEKRLTRLETLIKNGNRNTKCD